MRHKKKGRKLNRTSTHRQAMFRNMATALFRHGRIETTHPKAMELRRYAERLITKAKKSAVKGDVHSRRLVNRDIQDRIVLKKLFDEIAPTYASRPGGYTRVTRTRVRRGDNAPMAIIELVGNEQSASVIDSVGE